MQYKYVVCHYAEIGLKGKNRKFFEEKLVENIKKALLSPIGASERRTPSNEGLFKQVKRISGRILIEPGKGAVEKETDRKKIQQALKNVFGLAFFAFAGSCQQEIEAIKKKAVTILKTKKFDSFRVDTRRSKKDFPLTSQKVNQQVGEAILRKLKVKSEKLKVDLKKPDITLFIEIVEKFAFLYTERTAGLGGLPVSVSGKAVSLLSGGIDSPVASFYAQKRGIKLIFVHFHAYPYVQKASIEKVKKIIELLNKYQFSSKLFLVPFNDIQKEILLKTRAKFRVILYRRFMFKIAEILAKKERAKVLVTGENVGQVASQTLPNISVIEEAIGLPVLRPLICQDKQEIIEKAKEIGTFEISILPHQDCCARFLPKHPETKADLREVKNEEKKIKVDELIEETIKKTKIEKI